MKQRTITTAEQLNDAANSLRLLGGRLPIIVTVTEGTEIRSDGQNKRYWADMQYFLEQIDEAVERLTDNYGYTNIEVRREIAREMQKEYPPEYSMVLFARTKEVAHEIMKMICNIPTSTRLGTKEFQKFDTIRERTMVELLGIINAITR